MIVQGFVVAGDVIQDREDGGHIMLDQDNGALPIDLAQ